MVGKGLDFEELNKEHFAQLGNKIPTREKKIVVIPHSPEYLCSVDGFQ